MANVLCYFALFQYFLLYILVLRYIKVVTVLLEH